MLTFAEEILLLLLEDDTGLFAPVPESTVECALAGAVLMDLAFANAIDTDLERLFVVDASPTGNPIVDDVLAEIAAGGGASDTRAWVAHLSKDRAAAIRHAALQRLVQRGILRVEDDKFLWVLRGRRYPMIDGRAEREARDRITAVLLTDEIPDPHDVALICLADACNILPDVLPAGTVEQATPKVEQVRKMDLIGREVASAVGDIKRSIVLAVAQVPH